MVANIAMSGMLRDDARLWVLYHILYGDLTVSEDHLAFYAKFLSEPEGGKLKLNIPISPGIVREIHSVTDGVSVYSLWHGYIIMKLMKRNKEWHATRPESLLKEKVRSCVITSNRSTASLK